MGPLFCQVGWGQWFRYVTGGTEMLGAVLVLIPWTVTAGLVLLACTMAGAALIHILVMRHPFNAILPLAFLAVLIAFWRSRRED